MASFYEASEAHKKWGGHSQYGNKKWGGSATSLAIELTLFPANSGEAKAASAAAAPTPKYMCNPKVYNPYFLDSFKNQKLMFLMGCG